MRFIHADSANPRTDISLCCCFMADMAWGALAVAFICLFQYTIVLGADFLSLDF